MAAPIDAAAHDAPATTTRYAPRIDATRLVDVSCGRRSAAVNLDVDSQDGLAGGANASARHGTGPVVAPGGAPE